MTEMKQEDIDTEEATDCASSSMNNNKKRRANHMDPSGITISLESYKKLAADLLDDNRRLNAVNKDLRERLVRNKVNEDNDSVVEAKKLAAELLDDNKRLNVLVKDLKTRLERREQGDLQHANEDDDDFSSDDDERELGKKNNPWDNKYDEMRQYVVKHGNCMVPNKYKQNPSLGIWVKNQRHCYRNVQTNKKGGSKISQERIEKLDSIGFYWGKDYSSGVSRSFGDSFDDNVLALQEYKAAMGNFNVHPNQELGRWIVRIRAEYKLFAKGRTSLMTIQHIQKLKDIGFSWKKQRRATGVAKCLSV